MSNVTKKSLQEACVPGDAWAKVKRVCNSPAYKVKRELCRLIDGPFSGEYIYLDDYDSPRLTAPIKIGSEVGYYRHEARIHQKGATGKWVPL